MNLRILPLFALVSTLFLLSCAPSRADGWSPFGLSMMQQYENKSKYDPVTRRWTRGNQRSESSLPEYDTAVYGLRLGFMSAANREMYGLSASVFGNGWYGPCGNDTDGDIAGFQFASLFNEAASAYYGAWQLSGFYNSIAGGGKFVQVSGAVNTAQKGGSGAQIAGLANWAGGNFDGVQIAGVSNMAEKDMNGVQIAGLRNECKGTMRGVQIGAFNFAGRLEGVQIGLFNSVKHGISGMQLGGINGVESASASAVVVPLLRIAF